MKNIIKEYFKDKKLTNTSVDKFFKLNLAVKGYCEGILSIIPEYQTLFNVVKYIVKDKLLYKCDNCGNYLTVEQCNRVDKFNAFKYCSKCNTLKEIKKKERIDRLWKNKETNLKKYGVEYPRLNKVVLEKLKKTSLEKYGVEFPLANDKVQTKIKHTIFDRYGVDNIAKKSTFKNLEIYKDYIVPLFSKDEYINLNKEYKWKCVKCR